MGSNKTSQTSKPLTPEEQTASYNAALEGIFGKEIYQDSGGKDGKPGAIDNAKLRALMPQYQPANYVNPGEPMSPGYSAPTLKGNYTTSINPQQAQYTNPTTPADAQRAEWSPQYMAEYGDAVKAEDVSAKGFDFGRAATGENQTSEFGRYAPVSQAQTALAQSAQYSPFASSGEPIAAPVSQSTAAQAKVGEYAPLSTAQAKEAALTNAEFTKYAPVAQADADFKDYIAAQPFAASKYVDAGRARSLTGEDYNSLQQQLTQGYLAPVLAQLAKDTLAKDEELAARGIYTSGLADRSQSVLRGEYAPSITNAAAQATNQRYSLQSAEQQMLNNYALQRAAAANQANQFNAGGLNSFNLANNNTQNSFNLSQDAQRAALAQFNAAQGNAYNVNAGNAENAWRQFNAQNANQMAQFNAQNANQIAQFNAGQGNAYNTNIGNQQTGVNLANADALSENSQFNAGQGNAYNQNIYNQQMGNNQTNAQMQNAYNTNVGNQQTAINQFNAGNLTQTGLANALAANAYNQNLGNQLTANNQFNAQNANQMSQFNAGQGNAYNQNAGNQANALALANAGRATNTNLANATTQNDWRQNAIAAQNQFNLAQQAAGMQNNQFNATQGNAYNQFLAQLAAQNAENKNQFNLTNNEAYNRYLLENANLNNTAVNAQNQDAMRLAEAQNGWGLSAAQQFNAANMDRATLQNNFNLTNAQNKYAAAWKPTETLSGIWNGTGGVVSSSTGGGWTI